MQGVLTLMLSGYEIVCSSNYLQIMIHRIATTGGKSFLGVYMDMSASDFNLGSEYDPNH